MVYLGGAFKKRFILKENGQGVLVGAKSESGGENIFLYDLNIILGVFGRVPGSLVCQLQNYEATTCVSQPIAI